MHVDVHALTCPDRELNPQPFVLQDNTPTNRVHRPGQKVYFKNSFEDST